MKTQSRASHTAIACLIIGLAWLATLTMLILLFLLGIPLVEDNLGLLFVVGLIGPLIVGIVAWKAHQELRKNPVLTRDRLAVVASLICAVIGCTVLLLLPFFHMLRDSTMTMYNAKNFKQIGLAISSYASKHGHLPPPASTDADGRPFLSWRVLILPNWGEEELYRQFHLDEPWDSPHNLKLLPRMPLIYQHPVRRYREPGKTPYQLFVGGGATFEWGRTRTLEELTAGDGTSNTIFLVDAYDLVPWTKPADIDYDPSKPLPRFHVMRGKVIVGFGFGFCEAVAVPDTPEGERRFRACITWNGGEKVPGPGWD